MFINYTARIKLGFLGECLKCTKIQRDWIPDVFQVVDEKFPDLFRATIARFIEYFAGIELPEKERRLVAQAFES